MGNNPSYQQQYSLSPINPPLMATEERFIARRPICLNISITGDNYKVTDFQNNPWFRIFSTCMPSRVAMTLEDMNGRTILELKDRNFSGFDMKSSDGKIVVRASKKFFSSNRLSIKVYDKISGQQKLLTLKTRHHDTSGAIFIGEEKLNGIPIGLVEVFRFPNPEKHVIIYE